MKTIFTTIVTLSLVIFAATTGISNPVNNYTGDNLKKNNTKAASVNKAETATDVSDEFSYLRFDANEYLNENTETELPVNVLNYLRFDVTDYVESSASDIMEMPVSNELEYLRFDVNDFVSGNSSELDEMPVNDFGYLRFDVNKFANHTESVIDELPVTE